eukprot:1633286-Pleurochrysis_carterae.AAC.6
MGYLCNVLEYVEPLERGIPAYQENTLARIRMKVQIYCCNLKYVKDCSSVLPASALTDIPGYEQLLGVCKRNEEVALMSRTIGNLRFGQVGLMNKLQYAGA